MKHLISLCGVGAMILAGCSSQVGDAGDSANEVAADAGQAPSAAPSKDEKTGTVAFSDSNDDGLQLTVIDYGNNVLGTYVSGPFTAEIPKLSTKSLVELYLVMHPDAKSAPAALVALNSRLEALAEQDAHASAQQELPQTNSAIVDKSLSNFNSTVCRRLNGLDPLVCNYNTAAPYVNVDIGANLIGYATWYNYREGDVTYLWNETPYDGNIGFLAEHSSTYFFNGHYPPPWTWNWASLSGIGSETYRANFGCTSWPSGSPHYSNGITLHRATIK